jgi:hypothetical protein
MDIVDELKQKTLNSNAPSWAKRAIDEILKLRSEVSILNQAVVEDKIFIKMCDELRNQLAERQKDADRYRWLRESKSNPAYCAYSGQFGVSMIRGEVLDKAIDKAMSEKG